MFSAKTSRASRRQLHVHHTSSPGLINAMADFVKGLFGAQKPVQAPVVGDDGA
jgi:hypothetical protein